MSLPEILWHRLRLRYAGAVIEIPAGIGIVKKALCRQARRILADTNARFEAEQGRAQRPEGEGGGVRRASQISPGK
jgi:hypothetical protein